MVALNKHTDHMTSIKCHHLDDLHEEPWSPGGLLSTGELCVTGKVIPVHYYHQCPTTQGPFVVIIKHNRLFIFAWMLGGTFSGAKFAK